MKDILNPTWYGRPIRSTFHLEGWPILTTNRRQDMVDLIGFSISMPIHSTFHLWNQLSNHTVLSIVYHYMNDNL